MKIYKKDLCSYPVWFFMGLKLWTSLLPGVARGKRKNNDDE
jgi:hypothetical protein